MMKNNLDDLRATLEAIRAEKYPFIPATVVNEIIDIQYNNREDATKRKNDTIKTILKYASEIKPEGGNAQ